MVHAYSPVKPSPLSRILMLADSPDSPEGPPLPRLGSLTELEEPADGMDVDADGDDSDGDVDGPVSPTPVRRKTRLSLAQELGVADDDASDEEASDVEEVAALVRGKGKGKERAHDVPRRRSPRASARPVTSRTSSRAPDPRTKPRARSPGKALLAKPTEKENTKRSPRARAKLSARSRTRSSTSSSGAEGVSVRLTSKRSTVIGGEIGRAHV